MTMTHYSGKPKKKSEKQIPKGMPKRMDNPNSDYQRKTDYKLGKQTVMYFTKEDFAKLQRACLVHLQHAAKGSDAEYRWERNYVMMMLGVNLGCRTNTILEITPRDFAGGYFRVREHKTGKITQTELRDNIYRLLTDYTEKYGFTRDEFIFRAHRKSGNKPLSRTTAWSFVIQLSEECGITYNVGAYSLRKSFARWLYDENHDIFRVMRVMGHSDPIITARYICLEEEEVVNYPA